MNEEQFKENLINDLVSVLKDGKSVEIPKDESNKVAFNYIGQLQYTPGFFEHFGEDVRSHAFKQSATDLANDVLDLAKKEGRDVLNAKYLIGLDVSPSGGLMELVIKFTH